VLHEELPQILAVLGIPFNEMLGDGFTASLLQNSAATSATPPHSLPATRSPEQIADAYERANDAT